MNVFEALPEQGDGYAFVLFLVRPTTHTMRATFFSAKHACTQRKMHCSSIPWRCRLRKKGKSNSKGVQCQVKRLETSICKVFSISSVFCRSDQAGKWKVSMFLLRQLKNLKKSESKAHLFSPWTERRMRCCILIEQQLLE